MTTDCTVCGANPGEVCRGCYARSAANATGNLDFAEEMLKRAVIRRVRIRELTADRDHLAAEVERLKGQLAAAYEDAANMVHPHMDGIFLEAWCNVAWFSDYLSRLRDFIRRRGKEVAGGV